MNSLRDLGTFSPFGKLDPSRFKPDYGKYTTLLLIGIRKWLLTQPHWFNLLNLTWPGDGLAGRRSGVQAGANQDFKEMGKKRMHMTAGAISFRAEYHFERLAT